MITEKDLQEAIAECKGVKNPNANTCMKLASYYTILDHMADDLKPDFPAADGYSFAMSGVQPTVEFPGESEFSKMINGKDSAEAWKVMDELMTALQVLNPRLYASVMRKLEG